MSKFLSKYFKKYLKQNYFLQNYSMSVVACPFNAKHQIKRNEFRHHIAACPERNRLGYEQILSWSKFWILWLRVFFFIVELRKGEVMEMTTVTSISGSTTSLQAQAQYKTEPIAGWDEENWDDGETLFIIYWNCSIKIKTLTQRNKKGSCDSTIIKTRTFNVWFIVSSSKNVLVNPK